MLVAGSSHWARLGPGGAVAAWGEGAPPGTPDVAHDGPIAPGLVDLQVNGAAGVEAFDGAAALDAMDAVLAARGVTRWLAALPTAEEERVAAALDAIAERAADPAHGVQGAHLEGPFLSPGHPGVHRRALLRAPADGVPATYDHPAVRLVTLAPELPGALDLVARLHARGVAVALGHTGADAATVRAAADRGATLVTHLFNAMAPLHHRAPGPVGAALTDVRLTPTVIADGHHVDPLVLRLVHRAAGDRVVLVSDASAAAAAPDDAPDLAIAGIPVHRAADGTVRTADGTLAGSGILLDEAVPAWVAATGASAAQALAAASLRPARAAGIAPAGLVLAREDGTVERVLRWR